MPPKRDKTLTVGFSQGVLNHPFRISSVETMKAAAREASVRLLVTDGKGSTEVEVENIRWLLSRGIDALIVSSLSGPAIYPAYREVSDANIPLVLFASGVPADETPYTAFVGPDETDMGARAATFIGERLAGSGRIAIIRGVPESSNSRLRSSGFESALKSSFPKISIVKRETGQWLRRPAYEAAMRILAGAGRLDAIFAENDEMALGAVDALRSRERQTEAVVVGLDGQHEAIWEISHGLPFAMTIKTDWDASPALRVATAAAQGEEVPHRLLLDAPLIDQANAAPFLEQYANRVGAYAKH